jgi:YHS domain-containing protein
MKNKILFLFTFFLSLTHGIAQDVNYNVDKKFIAEGYDVVSYFNNKAIEGSDSYTFTYRGVKLKFVSQINLTKFKSNPEKFFPQYGGWCAYAMGIDGDKVSINPNTFEIRDGKLYLFYNSWGTNTLELWLKENPIKLQKAATINWGNVKYKN